MNYSFTCNHHASNNCHCVNVTLEMLMHPNEHRNMEHYIACAQLAFEHEGIRLQSFESDLITHDRSRLESVDPSVPFAFCVRESGTHLVLLTDRDGVGHRAWEYPGFVGDSFAGSPTKWFWWDGKRMHPLDTYVDACNLLREECLKRGIR